MKRSRQVCLELMLTKSREKMLKDRLCSWNCRRNITKQHVNYMVLKRSERERLGKETAFRIRGKEQSLQQLGSYWQRYIESIKGFPLEDLPSTPKDLTCFTPPPIPIAAPDDLHYQHRLLRSVQDYCFGNFDANIWVVESSNIYCATWISINPLIDHMDSMIEFAKIDDKARAQRSMSLASSFISKAALGHCPGLIRILLWYMHRLHRYCDEDLYVAFIKLLSHAASEVKRYLGVKNPLCTILEALSNRLTRFRDIYVTFWKCLVDSLVSRAGLSCWTTIWTVSDYNANIWLETDSQAAIRAQETLVTTCKKIYGAGAAITFNAQYMLAYCLGNIRRYQEAEDQLLQATAELQLASNSNLVANYNNVLTGLAYCQHKNGKVDPAEATLREAVQNSWIICGKTHYVTLRAIMELKSFLTETGRFDALEEVDAQITEIMDERDRLGI